MNKKNIILILVVTIIFLYKIDVYAKTCTTSEEKTLIKEALQIDVSYELSLWDNPYEADDSYHYNIRVLNLGPNLYVEINNVPYDYRYVKNGELFIENAYTNGGYSVTIEVYGNSKCKDKLLRSIKLKLPYYNAYSEREECANYTSYNICKRNANTSEITEEEFLKQIEKIKEKAKNQNTSLQEEEKEKNIFQKIITFYLENKKATIPVTIFVILVIIAIPIIIIRKNKKKIKIDFGGKL